MAEILIQDIEMPQGCGALTLNVWPDGQVEIIDTDGEWKTSKAVPVPPHGRLGDLDVLAQQIEHERFHHAHTDGLAARHHVAEYGHFLKAISDAPTIIPASEELT